MSQGNDLITIVTLSVVIAEQAQQLECCKDTIDRHRDDSEEMVRLRDQVYDLQDTNRFQRNSWEGRVSAAETALSIAKREIEALKSQLSLYESYSGPLPQPRTLAFMSILGGKAAAELQVGNFIGAIKEVRTITQWGLKEAKDFVEEFRAGKLAEEAKQYDNVSHPVCKDSTLLNA